MSNTPNIQTAQGKSPQDVYAGKQSSQEPHDI